MLFELITRLPPDVTRVIQAVAFDGTSATALLVDAATGRVLAPAKLYNEAQGGDAVDMAKVGPGGV
jgi:sugar (pentulose or hexulose) kinase